MRLIAAAADGRTFRSRPFRRDSAELALAYVADGRPIAVTIMNVDILRERRVLLHPALVDTALGQADHSRRYDYIQRDPERALVR